jgi:hypothetical protein
MYIYGDGECSARGQVGGAFQSLLTYSTLGSARRKVRPRCFSVILDLQHLSLESEVSGGGFPLPSSAGNGH